MHFRLVDAVEGEHGNVKAAEGKDRMFVLAAPGESGHDFIAEADGEQGKELVIRFEYRPAALTNWPKDERDGKKKPPVQKDLSALASKRILAVTGAAYAEWIAELAKLHVMESGELADYTRLEVHLKRYVACNTFDYFIHIRWPTTRERASRNMSPFLSKLVADADRDRLRRACGVVEGERRVCLRVKKRQRGGLMGPSPRRFRSCFLRVPAAGVGQYNKG